MNSISKTAISIIIFISLLGIGAFYTSDLHAEIGVEPENMELVVASGSETKGMYTVVNNADEPAHVKVDVEDWFKTRLGIKGIPVEQWIKVEPMEFDMEPKSTKQVEYVIAPPSDQEGELAAMIYFGTTSPQGGFSITSRFGVSIYAAIENTIKLECGIKDLNVVRNIKDAKETNLLDKGLVFVVTVENNGNVHIRPTGNIEILGEKGDKYDLKVERGFPVYQGKSLAYNVMWDKTDIAPGKYDVKVTLECGKIYNIDKRIEKKAVLVVRKNGTVSFQ